DHALDVVEIHLDVIGQAPDYLLNRRSQNRLERGADVFRQHLFAKRQCEYFAFAELKHRQLLAGIRIVIPAGNPILLDLQPKKVANEIQIVEKCTLSNLELLANLLPSMMGNPIELLAHQDNSFKPQGHRSPRWGPTIFGYGAKAMRLRN